MWKDAKNNNKQKQRKNAYTPPNWVKRLNMSIYYAM